MAVPLGWATPTQPAAGLIRATAARLLEDPEALFDAVDAAVLETAAEGVAADPALVAALGLSNRSAILQWTTANLRRPGAPVPPDFGPETIDIARDIVRRGFDDRALHGYRVGQSIAWRYWMGTAFSLSSDSEVLRAMLDITARSMSAYVDAAIAGIVGQISRERAQLLSGTHAERLEVVSLILEGAPISTERAGARLRYDLSARHTAYILWSDTGAPEHGQLEGAAHALAHTAGARRAFTIAASASALWAWIADVGDPDHAALRQTISASPEVRLAVGSSFAGIEGFRRSHVDALATQRLMYRMPNELQFATHQDVHLVALLAHDDAAREFVTRTLGDLATADPVLRETLRTYIREEFSPTRAAKVLFTHRNTVLNRLGRAKGMLPIPLSGRGVDVGLALEIVRWLGPRP